jgi:hypothetical protein
MIGSLFVEHSELEGGWVFPQKMVLTTSQLQAVNKDSANFDQWALNHGGVDPGILRIHLVVVGNRNYAVRVVRMQAISDCRPPLRGTVFLTPDAGSEDNIQLGFNLDLHDANAQNWSLQSGLYGDYFADKTISLQHGEQASLVLDALTSQYCHFTVRLTAIDGVHTITQTIDNHGHPFVMTGWVNGSSASPYSPYGALYVGGVASPNGDGTFVQESPSSFGR